MNSECLRLYNARSFAGGGARLHSLSLVINAGEIRGLLSMDRRQSQELMDIILGAVPLESGAVFWMDACVRDAAELQGKPIAVIRHESSLIDSASVAESIFVYKKHRHKGFIVPWRLIRRQTALQLREMGLTLQASARIDSLSHFERKLVELARAYLNGMKLIVIDELSASLTPAEVAQARSLFDFLTGNGVAILIIDTFLAKLTAYTHRLSILDHGYIQSFSHSEDWAGRYLEALKLPSVPEPSGDAREVAFQVAGLNIGDGFRPVSFQLYRGQLTELCDSGCGVHHRLLQCLFPETAVLSSRRADNSKIRWVDSRMERYLIETLSPVQNLCMGLYPRLSHMGVVSARNIQFIRREFNDWYGDASLLDKRLAGELSYREKIALMLFRFVIEGARVIFITDPRMRQDYNTFVYLITMFRRLADEHQLSVCILTDEHVEGDNFYDRRVNLADFMLNR